MNEPTRHPVVQRDLLNAAELLKRAKFDGVIYRPGDEMAMAQERIAKLEQALNAMAVMLAEWACPPRCRPALPSDVLRSQFGDTFDWVEGVDEYIQALQDEQD